MPPEKARSRSGHALVASWSCTGSFDDHAPVREGIEAKQGVGPDGVETFVLIRSVERREKERAMHARFARRIEDRVDRLDRRLRRARRPLDARRLERQLGRLLALNS